MTSYHIMLVDEEPSVLRDLECAIKRVEPKAKIKIAGGADQALEQLYEKKFDVIFLDIQMSGMDGLTLAEKAQELQPKIHIVFVTADRQYALDAFGIYASAYILKPAGEDEIREAFSHLRYPVPEKNRGLYVQCIGNFEVFFDGKPIRFHRSKTKELFAYLVDKRGACATNAELRAALWEDEVDDSTQKRNYFIQCVRELKMTLEELGCGSVFLHSRNSYALDTESFCCDIDSYLDSGENIPEPAYQGYMEQYEWARDRGGNGMGENIFRGILSEKY